MQARPAVVRVAFGFFGRGFFFDFPFFGPFEFPPFPRFPPPPFRFAHPLLVQGDQPSSPPRCFSALLRRDVASSDHVPMGGEAICLLPGAVTSGFPAAAFARAAASPQEHDRQRSSNRNHERDTLLQHWTPLEH